MTNGTPKKHVDGVTQYTAPRGRSKEIEMGVHARSVSQKTRVQFPGIFQAQFADACMQVHGPMVFVLKINWPTRETVFVCARARGFDLFHFERVKLCSRDACMHACMKSSWKFRG